MNKAVEAREKNNQAAAKEQTELVVLGYIQDFLNGKFVENDRNFNNELEYITDQLNDTSNQVHGNYKITVTNRLITVSDNVSNSKIVAGEIDENGTISWEQNYIIRSVESFAEIIPSSQSEVAALSTENNVKVIDKNGKSVIVPMNFGLAIDSGDTLEKGIVIEDASNDETKRGNQFVWVPVNQKLNINNNSTETILLSRYDFIEGSTPNYIAKNAQDPVNTKITESSVAFTYTIGDITYSAPASVARNIEDFISKTNSAKGYYIGRFEMGKDSNNNAVCKKNENVYTNITRDEAVNISQELYGIINQRYTSDLMNGYACDTALLYIEKCGTIVDYALQMEGSGADPSKTGSRNDEQCKINEMAKNAKEWTTESGSLSGYNCVYRGGYYIDGIRYSKPRFVYK